ncbi:type IVB secretion system protein IcmH/DotU [Burkholderia diffusa]|uniref:type IVB secretion system protein IcmH/DotU n=1 Tax=Burkholderia diffusa TaxID=488732 RepID=UPI000A746590
MTNTTMHSQNRIGAPVSPPFAARVKAAEQAVNPLLEAARVLLSALAETPDTLDAAAVARRRQWLEQELRLFMRVCSELRLRADHVKHAGYSLCSALDEAAMQTKWGRGDAAGVEWQTNGLAAAFGHDRQGGDRVFRLIDEAMRSPREHLDLIEVFQNILDLGFCGRYRHESGGRQRLQHIRECVHDAVVTGGLCFDPVADTVRTRARAVDPWVRPVRVRRSRLRIVGGLVAALLAGAGGYAAVDHWVRAKRARPPVSSLDLLAGSLSARLRDEIAAGNVELIAGTGRRALTLRLGGMFGPGDAAVAPWAASIVAAVGREIVASGEGSNILVTGYTDSVKASQARSGFNQALSEARARQVAQILVAAGVPAQHIGVVGKGDTDPLADNGTPDGRARNRRVEVTLSD